MVSVAGAVHLAFWPCLADVCLPLMLPLLAVAATAVVAVVVVVVMLLLWFVIGR